MMLTATMFKDTLKISRIFKALGISLRIALGIWIFNAVHVWLSRDYLIQIYRGTGLTPTMGADIWTILPFIVVLGLIVIAIFRLKLQATNGPQFNLYFAVTAIAAIVVGGLFFYEWTVQMVVDHFPK